MAEKKNSSWKLDPKPNFRHTVGLKQCNTAKVVSRLLKNEGELKGTRQIAPVLSPKVPSTQQHTHSPRREIGEGFDSFFRRSRVIEMGHLGAETILAHERKCEGEPFHAAQVRMTNITKQNLFPNTSRRYFHLDNKDHRCQQYQRKHSDKDYSRLQQTISAVTAFVDGNIASDVETATRNAGTSIPSSPSPANSLRIFFLSEYHSARPPSRLMMMIQLNFPLHTKQKMTAQRRATLCLSIFFVSPACRFPPQAAGLVQGLAARRPRLPLHR